MVEASAAVAPMPYNPARTVRRGVVRPRFPDPPRRRCPESGNRHHADQGSDNHCRARPTSEVNATLQPLRCAASLTGPRRSRAARRRATPAERHAQPRHRHGLRDRRKRRNPATGRRAIERIETERNLQQLDVGLTAWTTEIDASRHPRAVRSCRFAVRATGRRPKPQWRDTSTDAKLGRVLRDRREAGRPAQAAARPSSFHNRSDG